jgi:nitrogen-specific signal transduction histidine kinase
VRTADRAETSVEIAVTDNGPGVSPELRRRIFAWGVSGPGSTGQGIGLHTARDLMERQGGYLELVESGDRTTFVIGIPMLGCADDVADDRRTPAEGDRSGVAA